MSPQRWGQVKALYTATLERPERERSSFLAAECGGDEELRGEIESLLAARDEANARLEPPSPGATCATAEPPPDAMLGRRIGSYTLVGVLGHGGMGTVYEAEQEAPRRRVALKIVRGGKFVDQHVLRLFRREVQALALLQHPHIAAFHEAGNTDEGEHYFVMELVRGVPLIEFARAQALSLDQKLELFGRVCEAIAYAHQRGVIHRDIKPSNILVVDGNAETPRGPNPETRRSDHSPLTSHHSPSATPKILDFGLAKITESDLALTTLTGDLGKIQGTLAYMSPEQAAGRSADIDLRSDIYSLGVLLYEVLTDQLPYDVRSAPLPGAVRLICDQPPQRPSALNRVLRGDLETILLKTLEKDPARRYQSAIELTGEIRHYLAGEPIQARRDSAWYVLRKQIRRHRIAVAVAGAFALLLAGSSIVASALYLKARQAADVAESSRLESEAVTALLTEALQSAAEGRGNRYTVYEMLSEAAFRVNTKFGGQPLIEARVRQAIGAAFNQLGDFDLAEKHLKRALDLRRAALGAHHGDTLDVQLHLGRVFENRGALDTAGAAYREVLLALEGQTMPETSRLAHAQYRIGWLCRLQGKASEAEQHLNEALRFARLAYGPDHILVAETLNALGTTLFELNQGEKGWGCFQEALNIYRRVEGAASPKSADVEHNMGGWMLQAGRWDEAERHFQDALDIRLKSYPREHPLVASAMDDFAVVLVNQGRHAEAEPLQKEALSIRRKIFGSDHVEVAQSLQTLARVQGALKDFAAAEVSCREALEIMSRVLGRNHRRTLDFRLQLAANLKIQKKYEAAEAEYREALAVSRELFGPGHIEHAKSANNLATLLRAKGDYSNALPLFEEALEIVRADSSKPSHPLATCIANVASSLIALGDLDAAEPLVAEAVTTIRAASGLPPTVTADVQTMLGEHLVRVEDWRRAEPLLREALQIREASLDAPSASLAKNQMLLGRCLKGLANYEEAECLLMERHRTLCETRGPGDSESVAAARDVVELYEAWGKPEQAAEWRAKLAEWQASTQPALP